MFNIHLILKIVIKNYSCSNKKVCSKLFTCFLTHMLFLSDRVTIIHFVKCICCLTVFTAWCYKLWFDAQNTKLVQVWSIPLCSKFSHDARSRGNFLSTVVYIYNNLLLHGYFSVTVRAVLCSCSSPVVYISYNLLLDTSRLLSETYCVVASPQLSTSPTIYYWILLGYCERRAV